MIMLSCVVMKISILAILLSFCFLCTSTEETWSSAASFTTVRLLPGEDLMESLLKIAEENKLRAASIITCVGSLKKVNIRLANSGKGRPSEYLIKENDNYEIVSLVGTLEMENNLGRIGVDASDAPSPYAHLHISLADKRGNVIGGHLQKGSIVYTTVEITIMELNKLQYKRETCKLSGYEELTVSKRPTSDVSFLNT